MINSKVKRKKLELKVSYYPAVPQPEIYTNNTKTQSRKCICILVFIETVFTKVKSGKTQVLKHN